MRRGAPMPAIKVDIQATTGLQDLYFVAVNPKTAAVKRIFLSICSLFPPKVVKVLRLSEDIYQKKTFINITFYYLRVIFLQHP